MAFTSKMYKGEIIINDETPMEKIDTIEGAGKGYRPGLRKVPYGEIPGAKTPFPSELLIPESEFQARIQEAEEKKTRISDLVDQAGLPCKDQGQTSYCWINSPCHGVEVVRVIQNEPMVILSPASVGAVIKNFRNVGGWGGEGLEVAGEIGFVPVELWPANAIERKYNTSENRKIALKYRQTEWMELRPKNKQEMVSLLLHMIPGCAGLNWWSHEVTYYEPVWVDGDVAIRIRNSWGPGWGSNGYGILQGSRMYADELVAPLVAIAA